MCWTLKHFKKDVVFKMNTYELLWFLKCRYMSFYWMKKCLYLFIISRKFTMSWLSHNLFTVSNYYVFHGRITLFFANNSLLQCRITMKFLQNFLGPEVILSSHTMFINAPTKEFTLTHLVPFSISRSRIRMKFYFVYSLIRLWTKCLWMNW